MSAHLGLNCKLYRGTAGGNATTEMTNVKDVTLNMETGEADVTTRAANGWRVYLATLKEATLEFDMNVDSGDSDYGAIRSAFLGGTKLAFKVTDNSGQGIKFDGMVTGFNNSQPLEEADTVSVTIRPTENIASVGGSSSGSGS
jgi:hypothetical protein